MKLKPFNMSLIAFRLIVMISIFVSSSFAQADTATLKQLTKQSNKALAKIEEIQKIKASLKVIPDPDLQIIRSQKITPELENKLRNSFKKKIETIDSKVSGGVDSGGGTIVTTTQGQKGLIDFFTNAPELFGRSENRARIKIPNAKPFWRWGRWIDKVDFRSLDKDQSILQKIESWKDSSPKMADYLRNAYNNIPIFVSNRKLDFTDQRYFIPENLRSQIVSFKTVAFYNRENGLLISKPDFESQSYEDQFGLLMKELLRHVQINYDLNFTAEEMQRLNVKIIKGPQGNTSLDIFVTLSDKEIIMALYKSFTEISAVQLFKDCGEYSLKHNLGWKVSSEVTRESVSELMGQVRASAYRTENLSQLNDLKDIYSKLNKTTESFIFCNLNIQFDDPAFKDAVQGLNIMSREIKQN